MLEDICRVIRKGKDDFKVNALIKQYKREEYLRKMGGVVESYLSYLRDIEVLKSLEKDTDEIATKVADLLLEYQWLASEEIEIPEFVISDEEIVQYRKDNYSAMRKACYESRNQFELQVDGLWEDFILSVKDRFPKA